jgi:hypothetical protein
MPNFNNLDKFVHKCNSSTSQVILEKREAVAIVSEYQRLLRYTLELQERIISLQDTEIKIEYNAGEF